MNFFFFENRKFQFSKLFFSSKNFESEKNLDIKIDIKFYRESIFGIYFGIRALLRPPSEFLLFFSLTGIERIPPSEMAWNPSLFEPRFRVP